MTSLKVRFCALALGVCVEVVSVLIGLVATILARKEGVPTILGPFMLLPTFVLALIQVRRVARGEVVESQATARWLAWLTPLVTAAIVAGLVAVDLAWLLG